MHLVKPTENRMCLKTDTFLLVTKVFLFSKYVIVLKCSLVVLLFCCFVFPGDSCRAIDYFVSETGGDLGTLFVGTCTQGSNRKRDVVANLLTERSGCMSCPSGSFPMAILSWTYVFYHLHLYYCGRILIIVRIILSKASKINIGVSEHC